MHGEKFYQLHTETTTDERLDILTTVRNQNSLRSELRMGKENNPIFVWGGIKKSVHWDHCCLSSLGNIVTELPNGVFPLDGVFYPTFRLMIDLNTMFIKRMRYLHVGT